MKISLITWAFIEKYFPIKVLTRIIHQAANYPGENPTKTPTIFHKSQ